MRKVRGNGVEGAKYLYDKGDDRALAANIPADGGLKSASP
jgi:hypothetical protein